MWGGCRGESSGDRIHRMQPMCPREPPLAPGLGTRPRSLSASSAGLFCRHETQMYKLEHSLATNTRKELSSLRVERLETVPAECTGTQSSGDRFPENPEALCEAAGLTGQQLGPGSPSHGGREERGAYRTRSARRVMLRASGCLVREVSELRTRPLLRPWTCELCPGG